MGMKLVYHPLSCVINKRFNTLLKKNGTNELIYKTDINHRCGIHTYGYQEGKGKGGINWETGIDKKIKKTEGGMNMWT